MKNAGSRIPTLISILILMVLGGSVLTSCDQKDLAYPDETVNVVVDFDWQKAEGATPEGMTLLFFPADGTSKLWRFDLTGREGGEIELLSGAYNVLAYNNDLPGVGFTDIDSYNRYSATARSAGDSITSPTGMLYAAHISSVGIFNSDESGQVIILTPDSLSTVYHIRLDSVSGTERIKTANALIKGLARSVNLQLQHDSSETCALCAPLYISPDKQAVLETVTTGFGPPDIPDHRISLEVIVTTSHGKYSKSFDITDQVMNSINPKSVYINIKGLCIPAADTPPDPDDNPDVGISVGVDGWQLIEINYS